MIEESFFVIPGGALKSLRDELTILTGDDSSEILFRYGKRCGEDMASSLDFGVMSLEDVADNLNTLVAQIGLGRVDEVEVVDNEMMTVMSDALEISYLKGSSQKNCPYTRGYLTGLISGLTGTPYKVEETDANEEERTLGIWVVPGEDESETLYTGDLSMEGLEDDFELSGPGGGVNVQTTATQASELGRDPTKEVSGPDLDRVKNGFVYLVPDDDPESCYLLFKQLMESGNSGLLVTREFPKKVANRYAIESIPAIWLSSSGTKGTIAPEKLSAIYHELDNFIRNNNSPVVMISGMEYLASHNSFQSVLKFIQLLNEQTALNDAIMLIPISPLTLDQKELKVLERELEVLE